MRSNIASALSTTERGVERDRQQRIANNVGRALRRTQSCLRLYDLRSAVCATKHVGQHITRSRTTRTLPYHGRARVLTWLRPMRPSLDGQVRSPRQQVLNRDVSCLPPGFGQQHRAQPFSRAKSAHSVFAHPIYTCRALSKVYNQARTRSEIGHTGCAASTGALNFELPFSCVSGTQIPFS